MRRSMLIPIPMAAGLLLVLGCRPTPEQTGASHPETGATVATPRTAPNPPLPPTATPVPTAIPATSATDATTLTAARRSARPRALAAPQNPSQTQGSTPAPTGTGTTDPSAQDAALARQQTEQAARLARDQQQVLHQYARSQRQMQDEPRVQDSLGNQPPPYAPVIWPPRAQSQDPQGIQEAPGPAQTTPRPPPPPAAPPSQPPPASQPQSQPSSPPQ
jgi:hypothetical protein